MRKHLFEHSDWLLHESPSSVEFISVSVLIAIFLFIISKVCKKNATLDPRIFLFIFINPYIVTLINVSKQCVARWFSLGVCFWKKISILVRRNIWKKLMNTPPLDTPWSLPEYWTIWSTRSDQWSRSLFDRDLAHFFTKRTDHDLAHFFDDLMI